MEISYQHNVIPRKEREVEKKKQMVIITKKSCQSKQISNESGEWGENKQQQLQGHIQTI